MDIKTLINKRGRFSKAEIDFIIAEGAKVGVVPPKNQGCTNCWRDMAIEVAYAQRQTDPRPKAHRLRGAAARDGVRFKGRIVTNDTIDDDWEWLVANDFPKQLLEDEN